MTYQTLPQILARIDLFSGVPQHVLRDLVESGATFSTPPGGTVVNQDSPDAGLRVILEGTAEVDVGGAERPTIGAGGYFGEISVIDGAGRSATVTAGQEGLKTFTISPVVFSRLLDEHHELARSVLKALCARIRSLEASRPL